MMLQFGWVFLFISLASANLLVTNLHIRQKDRTGDTLFNQTLVYPQTLAQPLALQSTTPLTLVFDARLSNNDDETVELDQSMVSFQHLSTGADVTFPAKISQSAGEYKLSLTRKLFRKHFTQPGTYSMALVVGSSKAASGMLYEVGEVEVEVKAADKKTMRYGRKEEIRHLFGEPQRMPALAVSLIFTVLVCVPLAALAGAWHRLGVNLRNLRKDTAAFLGLVGVYMGLAIGYWVGIKLFPILTYCLVLALPTYLVGQYALS